MGPKPAAGAEDPDVVDAGGRPSSILEGGAFFDSDLSFGLIRGGHVDVCVLGALQVDAEANLASWIIPGELVPGMGGAMDLVTGARRVIVAMQHTAKGRPKILERCDLPLTARGEVDLIVTEYGVFDYAGGGLRLVEKHPEAEIAEIRAVTGANFSVSPKLKEMPA
jgi:acetate CoA/acetoacetate CoA-transferase beta subunit